MISDSVLETVQTNYATLNDEIELLISIIIQFSGKIPYIIDESNPNYPDFRPTYQPYDTFLLCLMANFSIYEIEFDQYFDFAFNEAINTNYGQQFANNTAAAYYINNMV